MSLFLGVGRRVSQQWQSLRLPLNQPLPLRVNFTWTFLGNAFYAASQWGMLTVMAKLGSPEMVGMFSLAVAICTPMIMLANMQLRVVLATDAQNDFPFDYYLSVRLITSLLAVLTIIGVAIGAGHRRETTLVIMVIGLAKAVEAVGDIIYGLLQKSERMDRIAISKAAKGLLSLLVLAIAIWLTGSLPAGALGLTAVWLLLVVGYDLRNARLLSVFRLRLEREACWRLVRLAFPLGLVMMLLSLTTSMPRYFIEYYQGESALGYYAAMAYLMVLGNMVVSAMGQSAAPRLSRYYAAGQRQAYSKLLLRLVGIGVILGIAAILLSALLGRAVLTILYRPDYAEYADILVWLTVAGGIGYVAALLGTGLSAARYFRIQLVLFSLVAVIMFLACAILVPRLGMLGAAQATIIAYLANLLGSIAVVLHVLRAAPSAIGEVED